MRRTALIFCLCLLVAGLPAGAQDDDAIILFPPPVYLLRGEIEIVGTADVPNMESYFLEYRPFDPDAEDDAGYLPATLARSTPVTEEVLGVWDTTAVDDGVYELRLTIARRNDEPVYVSVSPLRVENEPNPYAVRATPTPAGPTPDAAEQAATLVAATIAGTVAPTPIATFAPLVTEDPTVRLTIIVADANVRAGDGTIYPVLGSLRRTDTVEALGVSALGTGWYQVRLANGRIGWIAPSTVRVSGDETALPRVQPPPPPVTPTPLPSPTPATQVNLVAGIVVLNPPSPVCAQTFVVGFDVANLGTTATTVSGLVSLQDVRVADGSVQEVTIGAFPVLLPGQTFRVDMPLTVSTWYNETHRLELVIDPANQIFETNEADNTRVVEYVLPQGGCP